MKVKANEVELSLLPDHRLNEEQRNRDDPKSIGSIQVYGGKLQDIVSIPAHALDCKWRSSAA
jgi:hypothetical protein